MVGFAKLLHVALPIGMPNEIYVNALLTVIWGGFHLIFAVATVQLVATEPPMLKGEVHIPTKQYSCEKRALFKPMGVELFPKCHFSVLIFDIFAKLRLRTIIRSQ